MTFSNETVFWKNNVRFSQTITIFDENTKSIDGRSSVRTENLTLCDFDNKVNYVTCCDLFMSQIFIL